MMPAFHSLAFHQVTSVEVSPPKLNLPTEQCNRHARQHITLHMADGGEITITAFANEISDFLPNEVP